MSTVRALHYIPKPGGGLATPGEELSAEVLQKLTPAQYARLLRIGAIREEDGTGEQPAPIITGSVEEVADALSEPDADAEAQVKTVEEPPTIDALDGIIATPPGKPRGRRKKQ